jgi:signal transduction histidine kinase
MTTQEVPMLVRIRPHPAVPAASALTLVGVPAGLAMTGGNLDPVLTLTISFWLAVLALFLRRWPASVLVLSVASVAALRAADLIGSGWAWPATAAFVAVVLAGRMRTAVIVGAVTLVYGAIWDGFVDIDLTFNQALTRIGGETLWLAAVLAAAQAYRSTRRWQGEVAARLAQDVHERELDARRRRAEERVDIARDLHDVVSHTLAVVGVHLNVALDSFDTEPAEAREALRLAQDVRGRAMTDLKALVDVLRDGDVPEPAAGLEGVDRLVEQVRAAGLDVSVTEFGERAGVPAPVATAVYRVVQESLTNTVRHAGASRAVITLRYAPSSVVVDVTDDGPAGSGEIADGHGIAGMRERVAALGGALTAGPSNTGFTVRATIPFAA